MRSSRDGSAPVRVAHRSAGAGPLPSLVRLFFDNARIRRRERREQKDERKRGKVISFQEHWKRLGVL